MLVTVRDDYPIIDRGAWVDDLVPGSYAGFVEGASAGPVEFEIR